MRIELGSHGFYPAGGGRMRVTIQGGPALRPLQLDQAGALRRRRALALVSAVPGHVGTRELDVVRRELSRSGEELELRRIKPAQGPGNALLLLWECEALTEVFSAFGEKGLRAESVARRAVGRLRQHLELGAPVGPHLCDQLLLPLALCRGGGFVCGLLSPHAQTNIEVIERFLALRFEVQPQQGGRKLVQVHA